LELGLADKADNGMLAVDIDMVSNEEIGHGG
jgi:hypothetical protein